jgi:hypothetical protein
LGFFPQAIISANLAPAFVDLMICGSAEFRSSGHQLLLEICLNDFTILPVDPPTLQLFKSILPELMYEDLGAFSELILHFSSCDLQLVVDSGIVEDIMRQPEIEDLLLPCLIGILKKGIQNEDSDLFDYLMDLGLFSCLVKELARSGDPMESDLASQVESAVVEIMKYDEKYIKTLLLMEIPPALWSSLLSIYRMN